jgi:hypothetical protein
MGLDMWFREDEQRILATLAQTARRLPDDQFARGYLAAINDVAVAHGLIRPGGPGAHDGRIPASTRDCRKRLEVSERR